MSRQACGYPPETADLPSNAILGMRRRWRANPPLSNLSASSFKLQGFKVWQTAKSYLILHKPLPHICLYTRCVKQLKNPI